MCRYFICLHSLYFQILNWLYHSNEVGGNGQLDAKIHVYDGRSWVDRGGGGDYKDDEEDEDATSNDEPSSIQRSAEDEDPRKSQKQRQSFSSTTTTATMSQLLVDKAQMFHSGRYVCSALGASGTWTLVHILPGKIRFQNNYFIFSLFFVLLFWLFLFLVKVNLKNL